MISVDLSNVESIESSNHLYQWDKGQQLEIKGLSLSNAPEVHFGVNGSMLAIVVNSTLSGGIVYADIPNEILMSGKDLRVYVHIDGTTIKNILIPVFKRNMPENYVVDSSTVEWIEEFETKANEITTEKCNEIEAKGTSTLESIPDDYTALQNDVTDLKSDLNNVSNHIAVNGNYNETVTFGSSKGAVSNAYLIKGINYKIKNVNSSNSNIGIWISGHSSEQQDIINKGSEKDFTPEFSGFLAIYDTKSTQGSTVDIEIKNTSQVQFTDLLDQIKGSGINVTSASGTFNLDDCVPNQVYMISITNAINSPVADGGVCFITAYKGTAGSIYAQYYVATSGKLYTRFKKYGTQGWSEWIDYLDTKSGALCPSEVNVTSTNFDLNDAEKNKVYLVSTKCKNCPSESGGTLITLNSHMTYGGLYPQIFVDVNGILYTRYKKSSAVGWGDWVRYAKSDEIADIKTYAKLSIFDRVGIIGDSFASGALFNSDGTEIGEYPKISWIQQLARRNGFTGVNFSKGGLSTRTWLTSSNGLSKLNAENPCDLYILALGINDYWLEPDGYLGSVSDITSEPKPNSFYGNYAKIVEAVLTKNPTARIVMCTLTGTDTKPLAFSEAIRNIANHYNLPIVELLNEPYFRSSEYAQMKYGGHPTITSYSAMATAYENAISNTMFVYFDYFENGDYSK